MKISKLISKLAKIKEQHGDLEIRFSEYAEDGDGTVTSSELELFKVGYHGPDGYMPTTHYKKYLATSRKVADKLGFKEFTEARWKDYLGIHGPRLIMGSYGGTTRLSYLETAVEEMVDELKEG